MSTNNGHVVLELASDTDSDHTDSGKITIDVMVNQSSGGLGHGNCGVSIQT